MSSQNAIGQPRNKETQNCIDDKTWISFWEEHFEFLVFLHAAVECDNSSNNADCHQKTSYQVCVVRFPFSIIDEDINLSFEEIFKENGLFQLFDLFIVSTLRHNQIILKTVIFVQS